MGVLSTVVSGVAVAQVFATVNAALIWIDPVGLIDTRIPIFFLEQVVLTVVVVVSMAKIDKIAG